MGEVVGAYLTAAIIMVAIGFSGYFERIVQLIPRSIAAAMIAGILFQFGANAFYYCCEWLAIGCDDNGARISLVVSVRTKFHSAARRFKCASIVICLDTIVWATSIAFAACLYLAQYLIYRFFLVLLSLLL